MSGTVSVVPSLPQQVSTHVARQRGAGSIRRPRSGFMESLEARQLLAATDPVINEFLAANGRGLVDQFGDHSDWIELYNPGPQIDLGGWRLTDSPSDPAKWWQFDPNTVLAQGSYLVVFASQRDIRSGPELHTNFRLDKGGETLALIRPDGSIASEYDPYPAQVEDVSYGIVSGSISTVQAISGGSGAKLLVPPDGTLGTTWANKDFDDSGWSDAVTGVGFQRGNPVLPAEIEPNNDLGSASIASSNFTPHPGGLYHLGITGTAGSTADWFKIGSLEAGDLLTIAAAGEGGQRSNGSENLSLELWRAGQATAVATDTDSGPGNDALIPRFSVTTADTYYVLVRRADTSVLSADYQVGLWLENAGTAPKTGGNITAETEGNDSLAGADDLSSSWHIVQYSSRTAGSLMTGDVDVYRYQFHPKDLVTIQIDSVSSLSAKVSLLDANGNVVASEDGSSTLNSPYSRDSNIYAFIIPGTDTSHSDTYYVKVEAESGTGSYYAIVNLSNSTPPPAANDYDAYAGQSGSNLGYSMHNVNASAYLRIAFDGISPDTVSNLKLRMKYDDGFVAFINGQRVAGANDPSQLSWNSTATLEHPVSEATAFQTFDITSYKDALTTGTNILAIQGLNLSAGDDDFYILPELEYTAVINRVEQYFTTPTPGAANQNGAMGKVNDTQFSVDRGFYEQPIDVAITTATSSAEIRYTLDGSDPTATTGLVYSGPIHITQTTVLKAAAFRPGYIPTDVDSQTYIFLDGVLQQSATGLPDTWGYSGGTVKYPPGPDYDMDGRIVSANSSTIRDDLKSLPVVSLSMPMDDWFGSSTGIYVQGYGDPRRVSMEYFTADGAEQAQVNGSVEVQGSGYGGTSASRWKTYKLSFQLKFKEIYGDPKLREAIYGPDATDEFDTLILDAQINHTWLHAAVDQQTTAKYIQDQYISDLQNAAGGQAPHGRFVSLYINGLYWGMYDLHERPDEHFAAAYLGGNEDDYVFIKHSLSDPANSPEAGQLYQGLLDRVHADMSVDANYQRVLEVLDVDEFIDYMVINFYAGNHDWAHKNWYATFNKVAPDGKWRFHSWDAEHVLEDVSANNTTYNNAGGPTEIHMLLRANPEYRLRFADRVRKLCFNDGVLTPARAAAIYQARMSEVDRGIIGESARWGDNRSPSKPYTRDNWLATQDGLLTNFFPQRTSVLIKEFRRQGSGLNLYPAIDAPDFSQYGGTFADSATLSIANPNTSGTIYYTTDGSDPRLVGGAVSPAARVYAGPIALLDSHLVKARIFGTEWSALTEATFIVGAPPPLRVTEVMYHPAPPPPNTVYTAEDYEFVELQNMTASPLTIGGFRFTSGIDFTFPAGTTLEPSQRIVLARNPAAFRSRYGDGIEVLGTFADNLDNAGEQITLASDLGQDIESFHYRDGWYPNADGEGFSLVAIDPMASDAILSTAAGWRPSTRKGGSPGENEEGILPGSVVISEVMSNSTEPQGGWIELYNTTGQDVDISGWAISDSLLKLDKYIIPAGTRLRAGQYLLLREADAFGSTTGPNTPFALDPLGGEVHLTQMISSEPAGYREGVDFAAADSGVSFGRHVTSIGGADFVAMSQPTPGRVNSSPLVGPVVISEILYAPLAGGDEFVELRNITDAPVSLHDATTDWAFTSGIEFAFPAGASIAANSLALVVSVDPAVFRTRHTVPADVPIYGPFTGMLESTGEKLELSRVLLPEGSRTPRIVVDRLHYDIQTPWPTAPYTTGQSLIRTVMRGYANDPANWRAGLAGGAPGQADVNTIAGSAAADRFDLRLDPSGTSIQVYLNDPTSSRPPIRTIATLDPRPLIIATGDGDDVVNIVLPGLSGTAIILDPGGGSDELTLVNGSPDLHIPGGVVTLKLPNGITAGLLASGSASITVSGSSSFSRLHLNDTSTLKVAASGSNTVTARDLYVDACALLDLTDNDLIVKADPGTRQSVANAIASQIRGTSAGPVAAAPTGIITSAAGDNPESGLAAMLNDRGNGTPLFTKFSNRSVDGNSVLVGFTYNGDTDLNGRLDADDYFRLDRGLLSGQIGYRNGDFNYDGKIDADDYQLIDMAYQAYIRKGSAAPLSATAVKPAIQKVAKPAAHRHSQTPARKTHHKHTVRKPRAR